MSPDSRNLGEFQTLADLSPETLQYLDEHMPPFWSWANPVDMLANADPARYSIALKACLRDPNVDGILAILTPQAMTDAAGVARALVEIAENAYETVWLRSWVKMTWQKANVSLHGAKYQLIRNLKIPSNRF